MPRKTRLPVQLPRANRYANNPLTQSKYRAYEGELLIDELNRNSLYVGDGRTVFTKTVGLPIGAIFFHADPQRLNYMTYSLVAPCDSNFDVPKDRCPHFYSIVGTRFGKKNDAINTHPPTIPDKYATNTKFVLAKYIRVA